MRCAVILRPEYGYHSEKFAATLTANNPVDTKAMTKVTPEVKAKQKIKTEAKQEPKVKREVKTKPTAEATANAQADLNSKPKVEKNASRPSTAAAQSDKTKKALQKPSPDVDIAVIRAVLSASGGDFRSAFVALLGMGEQGANKDTQEEEEVVEIFRPAKRPKIVFDLTDD